MSVSTGPTSPTLCRPQHLDRERLRRLLASDEFETVCFHEAVVVVAVDDGHSGKSSSAPAFKLLALTSDALLLLPLGSGGGGSASPAGLPAVRTRVAFGDITAVARASPTQFKLCGMMVHANSELFEITVAGDLHAPPRRLFVATFEPRSRAFFYVARAFRLEFQRRILSADSVDSVDSDLSTATLDDAGDLHDLLQDLLAEVAATSDYTARSDLVDELATAATGNAVLQRLCFEDQTALGSCVAGNNRVVYGLPEFLVAEIVRLGDTDADTEAVLTYELSVLQLLHRLLFGAHWVAARLRFFLHTPLETWLCVVTHVPTRAKGTRTDAWRIARDELVDLQMALLLELQLLQEEAATMDTLEEHRRRDAAALALLTHGAHDVWLARVLKRMAVLVARTPQQLRDAEQHDARGSRWSLSLWRATRLLRKLLRVASVQGDRELAAMLRRRRRDYIDLYLRNPRFGRALAESCVPHLVDVADGLLEILDLLA